jgi:pimeloyl-ACP methyl ester carboxylesterase
VGGIQTGTVTSADGTVIVFDQSGAGPAVVLVQGALMGRADPVMSGLAAGLSRWFTVFSYDRRGRGDSGECAAPARPSRALYRGPCTACSRGKRTTAPEAIVPELLEFLITA